MNGVFHRELFIDFCKKEVGVGGPDPQMKILGELCKGVSFRDKMMLAGLYAIIYDVSSAEYAWNMLLKDNTTIESFVNDHWDSLVIRTERRCVRTKLNFIECVRAYSKWSSLRKHRYVRYRGRKLYDYMWNETTSLPYIGRYSGIKLLRAIRECAGIPIVEYDIRPKDAWSPRAALGLLYPKHADKLNDKSTNVEFVHGISTKALSLVNYLGVGYYELQALLCEYRETLKGNRFYPGRSHDEVLENFYQKKNLRGETGIFSARRKLFPKECLGEYGNRWKGVRKPLQATWKDHGYIWCDLLYEYKEPFNSKSPISRR